MKLPNSLPIERVLQACEDDDNTGFCLTCGNDQPNVEPDAHGYKCDTCGAMTVCGGMKSFDHKRLIKVKSGIDAGLESLKPCPARARTKDPLGYGFGPDSDKRLIVSLEEGDLICARPERTQRTIKITARDLWHYLNRCQANRTQLERARQKKERKAIRLAQLRQHRAEKKLFAR